MSNDFRQAPRISNLSKAKLASIAWLGLGGIGCALFYAHVFFPLPITALSLLCSGWFVVSRYKNGRLGLLATLSWAVFTLPFIHIIPYVWYDFDGMAPAKMWGLSTVPYMIDREIVELTGMIGAVGSFGLCAGYALTDSKVVFASPYADSRGKKPRTIAAPLWVGWLAVGVASSWLVAPRESLFYASYTVGKGLVSGTALGSGWMISYVILSFAFCDAVMEASIATRKVKMALAILAMAYVLIFLQLLRGDRAAVPWVFAIALAYFHWSRRVGERRERKIPWGKIAALAFSLLTLSMVVGAIRHSLVGVRDLDGLIQVLSENSAEKRIGLENLISGTWSAVLLTPLSVAGDYVRGIWTYQFGKDYVDLLLSMPPGFVADALNYQRPIDSMHGPALEMRYGLGGTHATVLPFRNFGMVGVLVITACWTYALARIEKRISRKITIVSLAFLVTLASILPHWLWYGEKSIINAILIWAFFGLSYRVFNALGKR